MDDAINDIGTALMRLREAFMKHHLPPPDGLEWSDKEKGRKIEILLRQHTEGIGNYAMREDAKTYRECTLAGFTMRYYASPLERFHPYDYTIYSPE